jgi:hypothetical protein
MVVRRKKGYASERYSDPIRSTKSLKADGKLGDHAAAKTANRSEIENAAAEGADAGNAKHTEA